MSDTRTSRAVKLTLIMPTAAMAVASLGGCEDPVDVHAYASVDGCVAQGIYSEGHCRRAFEMAEQENRMAAPEFTTKEDCQAQFGETECEQKEAKPETDENGKPITGSTSHSGIVFVPHMYGFGAHPSGGSALYRDNAGGFYTSSGRSIPVEAFSKAGVKAYPHSLQPNTSALRAQPGTISRGGFGATARGMSVGG